MYADHLLVPWFDSLSAAVPGLSVVDAHTHIGGNDPGGFTSQVDELVEALALVDGRAAVFPMSEPGGYRQANLSCTEAAAEHPDRLVAFARVTPEENPRGLLEEALDAGARGMKLHLSSDEFSLDDPRLAGALDLADEQHLPVMVHAGPEVESLRASVLAACSGRPGMQMILAHCAIPDLAHLAPHVDDVPNLFFDTSWWTPANLLALLRLVPPGRVLAASDLPYSTPLAATVATVRCAWQAGLGPEEVLSVAGGQMSRLLDREQPLDLGPAPSQRDDPKTAEASPFSSVLEVVTTNLLASVEAMQRGLEPEVPLQVARHACSVPTGQPDEAVLTSVLRLLDLYDEHRDALPRRNPFTPGRDVLLTAAVVARTPAAPLP
ncbi:amidohydrolase family protein [Knoellia sp. CPCC 206450]|uniref:amidohydrolase family protein n=1 Tax=Knoellia tibetensis TaxID=3404798 RepID=UPI003B43CDFD